MRDYCGQIYRLYETLSEIIAVRTLCAEGQAQVLYEDPPMALGPNAVRADAFAHARLGRENGVPPHLSLG